MANTERNTTVTKLLVVKKPSEEKPYERDRSFRVMRPSAKVATPLILILAFLLPDRSIAARFPHQGGVVLGKVADRRTGRPVADANVFLANTTLGAATGEDGGFIIPRVPPGVYNLVASHIAYQVQVRRVQIAPSETLRVDLNLTSRVLRGKEVEVVAPEPKEWKKDLKFFTERFLGESENARRCQILNPEVLDFTINASSNEFVARTDSVLRIENRALGYRLYIFLNSFRWHRTIRDQGYYEIYPRFEPLLPKDDGEMKRWSRNRRATYEGSARHFLAALVRGKAEEEGFELYTGGSPSDPHTGIRVRSDMLNLVSGTGFLNTLRLHFQGYLKVVYTRRGTYRETRPGIREFFYPVSWIELTSAYVEIDSLGNGLPPMTFARYGAWAKERVADVLPMDYPFEKEGHHQRQ